MQNSTSKILLTQTPAASRTGHGIVCIFSGMLLLALQDAMMKEMIGSFSVWQLIVARSVVALLILMPVILLIGGQHRILTPFCGLHILRGALFAVGFSLFYASFPYMNFANLVVIFFAAPLITTVMATALLGEVIGKHRKAALAIGFLGVTVALKPGSDSFQWISMLPLTCAVAYSFSQILVRRVGPQDSSLTIGLYTIVSMGMFVVPLGWAVNDVMGTGATAPHLGFHWQWPTVGTAPLLLAVGCVGMAAYVLLGRAYQVADISAVAPFEYCYLPIAAILGYFAWGEVPALTTIAGMMLITVSGVYIGHRELLASRRSIEPAPTAEAVLPGYPPPDVTDSLSTALETRATTISKQRETTLKGG